MSKAAAAAVLFLALAACQRHSPEFEPELAGLRAEFLHGKLDVALQHALKLRQSAATWPKDARARLALMQSEVLIYQGNSADAISVLAAAKDDNPAAGEWAIKYQILTALANFNESQIDLARQALGKATTLATASHSPLVGEVLRTQGQFAVADKHYGEAARLFGESLAVSRQHQDTFLTATDLLNLGFVSLMQERYDEALGRFGEAQILSQGIGADSLSQAALGNEGETFLRLGDYERALAIYQRAEQQAQASGAKSSEVVWLQDEGLAAFRLGDLRAARHYDEQALAGAEALHRPTETINIQTNLALLSYRQGEYEQARHYAGDALKNAEAGQEKTAAAYPRFLLGLLLARDRKASEAEQALMQAHDESTADPALRWEIENSIAHFWSSHQKPVVADGWFRRSLQTFELDRHGVTDEALRISFMTNGEALYRDYAEFLLEQGNSEQALEVLDAGRGRTLGEGLSGAQSIAAGTLRPREAAKRFKATVLFYSLGDRSHLWAITDKRVALFNLPSRRDIEALISRYQANVLRSEDALTSSDPAALELYQHLIEPAAPLIAEGSAVIVIPDGALTGFNLETVLAPSPAGPRYWLESVTLRTASSIGLMLTPHSATRASATGVLLIGDAQTGQADLPALAHAQEEVRRVASHFSEGERSLLTGAQAVPAAYARSHPDGFAYIHFVAHAVASRSSPMDSAVILSAPPDDPKAFKLYAHDIVGVPLRAELVTVSACDSSGVRSYEGEGLAGLAWAFMRAGAHQVIGALWQASDASTPALMDRLYAGIRQGLPPAEALRLAKIELLHSKNVFRKPLYWGAFQLYIGA